MAGAESTEGTTTTRRAKRAVETTSGRRPKMIRLTPPGALVFPVRQDFTDMAIAACAEDDVKKDEARLLFPHQFVALRLLLETLTPPENVDDAWFDALAAQPPLLIMPPGYGKTLVARGLCLTVGDTRLPVIYVTLSQLTAQTALEVARGDADNEVLGVATKRRLKTAPRDGPLDVHCASSAAHLERELGLEAPPGRRRVVIVSMRCFTKALATSDETLLAQHASSIGLLILDEAHQTREALHLSQILAERRVPFVAMTATPGDLLFTSCVFELQRHEVFEARLRMRQEMRRLAIPCRLNRNQILEDWQKYADNFWTAANLVQTRAAGPRAVVCLALQALFLSRFAGDGDGVVVDDCTAWEILKGVIAGLKSEDCFVVDDFLAPLMSQLAKKRGVGREVGCDAREVRKVLRRLQDKPRWRYWASVALALADDLPIPPSPGSVEHEVLRCLAIRSVTTAPSDVARLVEGSIARGCHRLLLRVETLQEVSVKAQELSAAVPKSVRVHALDGRRRPARRVAGFSTPRCAGRTVLARLVESPTACAGSLQRLAAKCPSITARILAFTEDHVVFVAARRTIDCGLNLQTAVDGILCDTLPRRRAEAQQLCGRLQRRVPLRVVPPPAWLVHGLRVGTLDDLAARFTIDLDLASLTD